MHPITACSLVILVAAGAGACVPSVPSVDDVPPSTPDAAGAQTPVPLPAPAAHDARASEPAREIDASRPEALADAGSDAGSDAGHADAAGGRADAEAGRADAAAEQGDASRDAPLPRAPRPGEIVIDELLIDPAGNDLGHEWVELANVTNEPLDLGALRVSDAVTEVAVAAGVLAAGAQLVLGQSVDRAHNGDAPVDVAYGTKLSLNNDADRVTVCLGACADGITLDAFAWTSAWTDAYVGHAVVLERAGATCPAATAYGAAGNFGSPGLPNPPCPTVRPEAPIDAHANDAQDGG